MQVQVKTMPMNMASEDMGQIQKKLHTCMLELTQARRELESLSGFDGPLNELQKCEQRIEGQAGYCGMFASAISQICRQYIHAENRMIEYSEQTRRNARRESAHAASQGGFHERGN